METAFATAFASYGASRATARQVASLCLFDGGLFREHWGLVKNGSESFFTGRQCSFFSLLLARSGRKAGPSRAGCHSVAVRGRAHKGALGMRNSEFGLRNDGMEEIGGGREGPLIVNRKTLIVKDERRDRGGGESEGPAFASYGAAVFAGAKTGEGWISSSPSTAGGMSSNANAGMAPSYADDR